MMIRVFKFRLKQFAALGLLSCASLGGLQAFAADESAVAQEDSSNSFAAEADQNEMNVTDSNESNSIASPEQWRHPGHRGPVVIVPPNVYVPPNTYVPPQAYPTPPQAYPNPNYGQPNYGHPQWGRPGRWHQQPMVCYQNRRGMEFRGYTIDQAYGACVAAGSRFCYISVCRY